MAKSRVPVQRPAQVDHSILPVMAGRWSPRAFDPRPVEPEKLLRVFEAARWAASSYNEQPWRYFVALKDEAHRPLLESFLVDQNAWAKSAPVLMLVAASTIFAKNRKPNPVAVHDIGLADGNFSLQAVHEGLCAHGMAGFHADRAKTGLNLPDDIVPVAMWAIGYPGYLEDLPDNLRGVEMAERTRRPLKESFFTDRLDRAHGLVS